MALYLNDLTSNANNLTNNGATDITTALPFTQATHAAKVVSASTQYLTAADANQLSVSTTGKMTWEFWLKVTSLNDNNYAIWKGVGSNFEYQIIVGNSSGQITTSLFSLVGNARYTHASANSVIGTGTWYHIAVTIDDTLAFNQTNLQMYVDEVEKTNITAGASGNALGNGTAALDIGRRTDTLAYGDFQICDLRIWNTIRTSTQLANNKNQYLVGSESGLVAYYPLGLPTTGGAFLLNYL